MVIFISLNVVACAGPEDDGTEAPYCGPDYELQMVEFPDAVVRKAQLFSCGSTLMANGSGYFKAIFVDDETLSFYGYLSYNNGSDIWEP